MLNHLSSYEIMISYLKIKNIGFNVLQVTRKSKEEKINLLI